MSKVSVKRALLAFLGSLCQAVGWLSALAGSGLCFAQFPEFRWADCCCLLASTLWLTGSMLTVLEGCLISRYQEKRRYLSTLMMISLVSILCDWLSISLYNRQHVLLAPASLAAIANTLMSLLIMMSVLSYCA